MAIQYDPSPTALFSPEQRDTIFESGRAYSVLQLAVEAARLAYFRAEASDSERRRLESALAFVEFGDLTLFGDAGTGALAYAARRSSDGTALIAFRGTQPDDIKDLLADAEAKLERWPESAGRVHSGFAGDALALKGQIGAWMESRRPDPNRLILTGHSLGAALATLAATIWRPAWLITLGSPRVGDGAFAATVVAANSVRFVDCCDLVTDLPPPVGGYVHVKESTYLNRHAKIVEAPSFATVTADGGIAHVQYSARYPWMPWRALPTRSLADHAPINYARVVFP